jgi:hypothetical protein
MSARRFVVCLSCSGGDVAAFRRAAQLTRNLEKPSGNRFSLTSLPFTQGTSLIPGFLTARCARGKPGAPTLRCGRSSADRFVPEGRKSGRPERAGPSTEKGHP